MTTKTVETPSGSKTVSETTRKDYKGRTSDDPNFTGPRPILLDLDGDGIQITDASKSTQFVDAGGDGLLHRSAWAAAGNGVLFFDAGGDGQITEKREYVFTEWDPTAEDDLAALRAVFDTNGDGKLTAADAAFGQFKVLVTNADGSTTAQTLTQLGITEINLTADATRIVLPDGSVITGQTTFTRANGTTGTVANTTLIAEADGHRVVQVTSTDVAGNRVVVSTAYASDGSVAYAIRSVTSPTGASTTNTYDDNGDGVTDRIQTIVRVTNGDGSRTETVINKMGADAATAVLDDRTVTVTSADNKVVTINRDTNGGGWFDEREVRTTHADGSRTQVISELSQDGTVIRSTSETMSVNGLTRSEGVDADGNGTTDLTTAHVITVAGDNSRTEVVTQTNGDGSVRGAMTETVSANGRVHVEAHDLDGDGDTDRIDDTAIVVNAGGATTSTILVKNGDGSIRTTTVQTQSADALTKTTTVDADGDGDVDLTTVSATVIAADTSRVTTTTATNTDGSVRGEQKVTLGADKVTSETWVDLNQNGVFEATDQVRTVAVTAGTLARTTTLWDRNADGSVMAKTVSVSTADGLNIATTRDADGDGDIDTSVSDVTVLNASNVATQTIITSNHDASLRSKTVVTTSADGLTMTQQTDLDGSGSDDQKMVDASVVAADQSVTRTVSEYAGNGTTLTGKSVTFQSADRRTTTVTTDGNGDGFTDSVMSSVEAVDGSKTVTETGFYANGSVAWKDVSTTSANGLVTTRTSDRNGDTINETVATDTTVLNANGSRTRTIDVNNGDGSNRSLTVSTVSDDGLSATTQTDSDGNGVFERVATSLDVLNANGSTTVTAQTRAANTALLNQVQTVTSDDGLVVTTQSDADGDGDFDLRTVQTTVLQNNGGTVVSQELRDAANVLRNRVSTSASDDGRVVTVSSDVNGDWQNDVVTSRVIADNGTRTTKETNRSAAGVLQSQTVNVVSDDGLSSIMQYDRNGDGAYELNETRSTVLNADGSSTTTVEQKGASGNVFARETTTTSDDGWNTTTTSDIDGNGDVEFTSVQNIALSATGIRTVTTTQASENATLIRNETVVTSADKRSLTTSLDTDGNGINDGVTTTTIANNGITTASTTFFSRGGTADATLVTTVSGDGLITTRTVDYNADNRADLIMTDVTDLGEDGTTTRNISFRNERFVTLASEQFEISDDGLTRSTQIDLNGDGVLEFRTEEQMVYEADGDIVRTQRTFDGASTELSGIRTSTSGNGLTTTVAKDFTGDGIADYQRNIAQLADGAATETTLFYKDGLQLSHSRVEAISADGRTRAAVIDRDGDGYVDREITVQTDLSRNVVTTAEDIALNGTTKAKVVSTISANGMTSSRALDIDGDGNTDITVNRVTTFGSDGSRTTVMSDVYGLSKTTYQETTVTAANGLLSTSSFDVDGDGTVDGTSISQTIVNADGSRRLVDTTFYADGTTRTNAEQSVSADGRSILERVDYDGNGVWDKTQETTIGADGARVIIETGFNRGGLPGQIFETRVSADGLETTIIRSGNQQTITRSAVDNGSYVWSNGVAAAVGKTNIVVSHKIDDLGIETWTIDKAWRYTHTWEAGGEIRSETRSDSSTKTVRLDAETKDKIIADAASIYDAVLDRSLDFNEVEELVTLIIDGQLDKVALTTSLFTGKSDEFATRYGTMSNGEFVQQIYLNAFGRAPSLDELSQSLQFLGTGGTTTAALRSAFALDVAERLEHAIVGNGHMSTNNFDVIINPATFERSLDKAYIASVVKNLVDVVYDRDATDQEIDFLSDKLLRDVSNPDDIAGLLRAVNGSIQGVSSSSLMGLSGAALVTQAFNNALGRQPSAEELTKWQDHIAAGQISVEQFIASLAASVEKLSAGNGHLAASSPPVVTPHVGSGANETLTGGTGQDFLQGNGGNDSLVGGEGSDRLNGGIGNDTLVGGNGNDLYEWSRTQDNDTIVDLGANQIETDILTLSDVASTEVNFLRVLGTDDLRVQIGPLGPYVTVSRMLENLAYGYGIEEIRFSDGISWNRDEILAQTTTTVGTVHVEGRGRYTENLIGSMDGDTLTGSAGNDTLTGNGGADSLVGAAGEDVYRWSRGHGADTINDAALSTIDVDRLILTDVDASKVQLIRNQGNDDLIVRIISATSTAVEADILIINRFTVAAVAGWTSGQGGNQYALNGQGIELITFADGTTWNLRDILDKTELTGTTVANALTGTHFDDKIVGLDGNDTLTGYNGNDTLVGGLNDDYLDGGAGTDTYIWRVSDGNDTIADGGVTLAERDVLVLENVSSSLVGLSRVNGSTTLNVNISAVAGGAVVSTISVLSEFLAHATAQYGVEAIRFGDGAEWTLADIWSRTKVVGTAGADTLSGTTFIDNLYGGGGSDVISAGANNDLIVGGGGNDTVDGADGNDRFEWSRGDGNDLIRDSAISTSEVDSLILTNVAYSSVTLGKAGTNLTIGITGTTTETITVENRFNATGYGYGVEVIMFSDGVIVEVLASPVAEISVEGSDIGQTLSGWTFVDIIDGKGGADIIDSKNGNDRLIGGDGNDTLKGGNGADTYVWSVGDDSDQIDDLGLSLTEIDRLELNGITADNLTFKRVSGSIDLQLLIDGGINGIITVKNRFAAPSGTTFYGYGIEEIVFDDGTVLTLDEIFDRTRVEGTAANDTVNGTAHRDNLFGLVGADTLNGGDGRDTLTGNAGADSLAGGEGDDVYVWSRGDGNDTINDASASFAVTDVLKLTDVYQHEVSLTRAIGSTSAILTVQSPTGNETITLLYRYYNATESYGVDAIEFADGTIWTVQDILDKTISAGAGNVYGTNLRDNLRGSAGIDTLTGYQGDDILEGGAGNDFLHGGSTANATADGNDRYIWKQGDGNDTILDRSTSLTEVDTLVLSDVLSTGVSLTRVNGTTDLKVNILASAESILIQYRFYLATSGYGIENIEFSDGVVWTLNDILAKTSVVGLATSETLSGTTYADRMFGNGGNDTLNGSTGDDTLDGGAGADSINGGTGVDTVSYKFETSGVLVDLSLTVAQTGTAGSAQVGDILVSIEGLEGTNFADTLRGSVASNDLWGLGGNDTITGGDGYDRLYGGEGADSLDGGIGADLLDGGIGADTFRFNDIAFGNDTISGFEDGSDLLSFGPAIADDIGDFAIAGNGSALVTVTVGGNTITVVGLGSVNLSAADFVFV